MEDKFYKAFYYDAHKGLIATDTITCINGAGYDEAFRLASSIADGEYPDCVEIEVCELAEKNSSAGHTEAVVWES